MSRDHRMSLPDVTLVAVSSVALEATVAALRISSADICFGDIILLSDRLPDGGIPPEIRWHQISPITSRATYSRFILRDLAPFVTTTHALCVQWDGYILDAHAWSDSFLEYDYIGAPWPQFPIGSDVGNGGFSLRSKKLLNLTPTLPTNADMAEDVAIGRTFRAYLEDVHAVRFAPHDIARRFAYERFPPEKNQFGFHGVFNMPDIMGNAAIALLIRELEPGIVGKRERRDLFRWALKNKDWRLALALWRHRRR